MLRGKHNMLRLSGLAGKVLVVDEVHAYDAYMQGLLGRLLQWLGSLGVPVVLLSATLPAQTGRRLVEAYLSGAGHRVTGVPAAEYPGWLYADAVTGQVSAHEPQVPSRGHVFSSLDLDVDLCRVRVRDGAVNRAPELRRLLQPMIDAGDGSVGIICNTVAEAQDTFAALEAWFDEVTRAGHAAPELRLLHSRFPAEDRAEITRAVVRRFGKDSQKKGLRETPCVLVATQVVEQSIDLDFDLLISDLAPVAMLLQRAGRCWRHRGNRRPSWSGGARLAVLTPVDAADEFVVPKAWPFVYPKALLRRTSDQLSGRRGQPIRIPEHVQALVDAVYDMDFLDPDAPMAEDDIERIADEQVRTMLSERYAVPAPDAVRDLGELTESWIEEDTARTRLGADSARVLCCYRSPVGDRFLDSELLERLPDRGSAAKGRFTRGEVRKLLARVIPVPGAWVREPTAENVPPDAWRQNVHLRDVLLIELQVDRPDQFRPGQLGGNEYELHEQLGLVRLP